MQQEIWKDIPGYEGLYQVSSLGRIKSFKFNKEKILKPHYNRKGYMIIGLSKNLNKKNYILHRLLPSAFIPNPENKPQVNHINGIRDDNRLENLEWCTISENQLHSFNILGRKACMYGRFGKDNHLSKAINQYDLEGNFIKTWDSTMDIERELKIKHSGISSCCKGKYKFAGGFIWKYKKD